MRILNVKDAAKNYSRYAMPGFRSGSMVKRIIACLYYFFVLVFAVNSVIITMSGNFASGTDVAVAILVEIMIIAMLISPIVIIGFSNHYEWHGIKLFLMIMVSWCVLFTIAQFASTLFSDEFINSNNMTKQSDSIVSESESDAQKGEVDTKIDSDIIIDNIEQSASDAAKGE